MNNESNQYGTSIEKREYKTDHAVELIDGKFHRLDRIAKTATDVSSRWDIKDLVVQNDFRIGFYPNENSKFTYYIDGDVYTRVSIVEDFMSTRKEVWQTKVTDSKLTYLNYYEFSSDLKGDNVTRTTKIVNSSYKELNFKNVKLKKTDVSNYTYVKEGNF